MNKKRLLILLVLALGIALAYAYWRTPQQERVVRPAAGTAEKKRGPGEKESRPAGGNDLRVRLDLLQRSGDGPTRPRRDLFASLAHRPKLAAQPVEAAPPPPPPAVDPLSIAPPVAEAPPPPPAPPSEPPVQFTFLGFLQKEVQRTVFLSAGGEIYVVKKGDRFGRERQFTVTDLTAERLVIRNRDNQPIVISLADPGSAGSSGGRSDVRPLRTPPPSRPFAERTTAAAEMPTDSFEPADAAPPPPPSPVEGGILRPLPRSNLNNLFSDDQEPARSRPQVPQPMARTGAVMPSDEVP